MAIVVERKEGNCQQVTWYIVNVQHNQIWGKRQMRKWQKRCQRFIYIYIYIWVINKINQQWQTWSVCMYVVGTSLLLDHPNDNFFHFSRYRGTCLCQVPRWIVFLCLFTGWLDIVHCNYTGKKLDGNVNHKTEHCNQ